MRALSRAARVLERAAGELTLAQYRVLSAVEAGTQRASRLAARLAMGKPTVSTTVESLCRRGLMRRAQEAGDQRASALTLTTAGRRTLAEVEAAMVRRLDDLCARTEDPARLVEELGRLGAAIERLSVERAQL